MALCLSARLPFQGVGALPEQKALVGCLRRQQSRKLLLRGPKQERPAERPTVH
jgi:hypothetical protein